MSAAEERVEAARRALIATGYFSEDQVGDDIAPRIVELWSALDIHPRHRLARWRRRLDVLLAGILGPPCRHGCGSRVFSRDVAVHEEIEHCGDRA